MMRPLWLDFQRPPPGARRAGMLLLLAGLGASGALLVAYHQLGTRDDAAREQIARLKRDAGRREITTATAAATAAADIRRAGENAVATAYSPERWETLFTALESAGDEDTTLLSLQPGAGDVRLTGEARNLAAAMAYLTRLQAGHRFTNVYLTQSEVLREHPQHPVRFALTAEWPGAGS